MALLIFIVLSYFIKWERKGVKSNYLINIKSVNIILYITMAQRLKLHFDVGQQLSANNMNEIVDAINDAENITDVTYDELVSIRNLYHLTPGMYYKITDYVTTTSTVNTQSAGHRFDIIVKALDTNVLSETDVYATWHTGNAITEKRLYKTEIKGKYADEVDTDDYYKYDGTIEIDDVTYYKWKKYDHGGEKWKKYDHGGEDQGWWILTDTNDFSDVSLSNPYIPVGSMHDDGIMDNELYGPHDLIVGHGEIEGVPVLYKTDLISDYADEIDEYEYYKLEGQYELDGDVYYRWKKYENNSPLSSSHSMYILTETDEISCSFDNPYIPIAYIDDDDEKGEEYIAKKNDAFVELRTVVVMEDPYFEKSNIYAWRLNYCLDNDTKRFAWADTTNGKGVIYWMKDEWGNECPYDFKNIQFKRFAITEYNKVPSLVVDNGENKYGYYYGAMQLNGESQVISNAVYGENFEWLYTFALKDLATGTWHDYTVVAHLGLKGDEGYALTCYGNKIGQCRYDYVNEDGDGELVTILNDVVFMNCYGDLSDTSYSDDYSYCYSNVLADNCFSNTFGNYCQYNTFGNDFRYNTFGNECYNNTFGNNIWYNTFGNDCGGNTFGNDNNRNTFGNGIGSNTFGNDCYRNTFGNGCWKNTFGNECYSNTFGNECYSNTFGNYCYNNTFGNECYSNTFGNNCYRNTFGNSCYSNTFGNDCFKNTFGNNFRYNTFGNGCYRNTFGNDYIRWCAFGDGVQFCSITGYSTGSSNYLQNIIVLNGTQGTDGSNLLSLSGLSVGVSYSQTCGMNSSGTYTHKNIMD